MIAVASGDPFQPPSAVADAQEHYVHAKQLFADKSYAAAADEFAKAYELDPSAKFLLFNLGLAQRMASACPAAIASYREFIAAHPPDELVANAQIGIDKCTAALAATEPKTLPHQPPPPAPAPAPEPWYHDSLGDALVIGGVVSALAGGAFYLLAHNDASNTFSAPSLLEWQSNKDAASTDQTVAWIATGVGASLVVAGAIRYATRPAPALSVAATRGGAAVALEVRW
jgi:tetratricopeptide (TPR) repeat protein